MKEKESEPMSQWKFNNFETEIDFTDADFMENSMDMRVKAANSLFDLRNSEQSRYNSMVNKYTPNRKARRGAKKN